MMLLSSSKSVFQLILILNHYELYQTLFHESTAAEKNPYELDSALIYETVVFSRQHCFNLKHWRDAYRDWRVKTRRRLNVHVNFCDLLEK